MQASAFLKKAICRLYSFTHINTDSSLFSKMFFLQVPLKFVKKKCILVCRLIASWYAGFLISLQNLGFKIQRKILVYRHKQPQPGIPPLILAETMEVRKSSLILDGGSI